ncbi:hypothetical protein tb265_07040 [Gemmatimonadetes bacterium T265]|nr:hypothetical protein tb265_07040 [Gemmatimonadetes bacterium T265]
MWRTPITTFVSLVAVVAASPQPGPRSHGRAEARPGGAALMIPARVGPARGSVPDSDEVALGAALVAQFDADRGVASTPETRRIEAYLQGVADALGRHTRRRLPWRVHFDPHPGIKSAFALPGGQIVVWGGILAYMTTEDEAAALIAHEIAHVDDGQVSRRLDSLRTTRHRDVRAPGPWRWGEFGASYGPTLEYRCDSLGAALAVRAGYAPYAYRTLLESFVALGRVHAPAAPPARELTDRIAQIEREIAAEHWEGRTRTRPLQLPGAGD